MGEYYKSPQYGTVFCNEDFPTPPCRVAFPHLGTPKAAPQPRPGEQPGKPRYEVTLLFPKESKLHKAHLAVFEAKAAEMLELFNKGRQAKIAELDVSRDGDAPYFQEGQNVDKYTYYKGQGLVIARNTNPVPCIGPNGAAIKGDEIKGGMLVSAVISPIVTASGLTYKLKAVQLLKDDGIAFARGGRDEADYIKMLTTATQGFTSEAEGSSEQMEAPTKEVEEKATSKAKKPGRSTVANLV